MTRTGDVRMSGFRSRTSVQEAWRWIEALGPLPVVSVPLAVACGRVLAQDVCAAISVPEFPRSAMDGYAVVASDIAAASPASPKRLQVVGDALPANPFSGQVLAGTAVRIMTGAPLPAGADVVVPVEATRRDDAAVLIEHPLPRHKHVAAVGEDVQTGQQLLARGRRLRPQDVAIAASVGLSQLTVLQAPRVAILATGNELVTPGQSRAPYQIYDANSSMLQGLVERDGGSVTALQIVRDGRDLLRDSLLQSDADVVLVSGGSSVGLEDYAPQLVRELGELPIHGVAMRPAGPAGMGRIGNRLVFLLPGNPVSCLCAYDFFAGRALRKLGGRTVDWPYRPVTAVLERELKSVTGRLDYVRVRLQHGQIEQLALTGASILSSTVRADGFVVIPEAVELYPAGTELPVYQYDLDAVQGPAPR